MAICWSAPRYIPPAVQQETIFDLINSLNVTTLVSNSTAAQADYFAGVNWNSTLEPDFVAGATSMLAQCPGSTDIHMDIEVLATHENDEHAEEHEEHQQEHVEHETAGERLEEQASQKLRIHKPYQYHMAVTIDLGAIRTVYGLADDAFFASDHGDHSEVSARIIFCPVNGNLCSPFVRERHTGVKEEVTLGAGHVEGDAHAEGDNRDHGDEEDDHKDHGDEEVEEEDDHGHAHRWLQRARYWSAPSSLQPLVRRRVQTDWGIFEIVDSFVEDQHDLEEDADEDHDEEEHLEEVHDNEEDHKEGDEDHEDEDEHDHGEEDDHGDQDNNGNEEGGDEHGGHGHGADDEFLFLHELYSPTFFIPVDKDTNETVFVFHLDIDLSVPAPGNYLPLATVQFFLNNGTSSTGSNTTVRRIAECATGAECEETYDAGSILKFDIGNLLHQRAVFFYNPIDIRTVSRGVEILSYVLVGLVALIQTLLLGYSIYCRNEGVMKLSQGGFLILLQTAGIVATACSVLYLPRSNITCALRGPLTLIPIQFMLAIIFGRLRRIVSIMAPLLEWHSPRTKSQVKTGLKTWRRAFMFGNSNGSSSTDSSDKKNSRNSNQSNASQTDEAEPPPQPRRVSKWFGNAGAVMAKRTTVLRQTFSATRLWMFITLITLPMVIVEIVGLTIYNHELELMLNEEESVGRYECGNKAEQIYQLAAPGVVLITLFFVLFEAHRSRHLPALFNEAMSVSAAAVLSLFVSVLGFAVIIVTDSPEASPDVAYLMELIIISTLSLNLSLRLVVPKLLLVWRGEKVVISKILSDHRRSQQSQSLPPEDQTYSGLRQSSEDVLLRMSSDNTSLPAPDSLNFVSSTRWEEDTNRGDSEFEPQDPPPPIFKPSSYSEPYKSNSIAEQYNANGNIGENDEDNHIDEEEQVDEEEETTKEEASDGTPQKEEERAEKKEKAAVEVAAVAAPATQTGARRISFSLDTRSVKTLRSRGRKSKSPEKEPSAIVVRQGAQVPSKIMVPVLALTRTTARLNERILSGLQLQRSDWDELATTVDDLKEVLDRVEFH